MRLKAAVARRHGAPLSIESLEIGPPRADEIVVRLVGAGVARSDLDAIDGTLPMPLPFVPGCEGAGIVEQVGDAVDHVVPGDAVIVTFAFCGCCPNCAAGHPRACVDFGALNLSGRRLDGSTAFSGEIGGHFFGQSSFATHTICRAASAIKVPPGAPLELVACLGGDLLLGAGAISHGLRVGHGDSLVVNGAGAEGLVAIMVARALGAAPIVVADPDAAHRDRATEFGATVAVHGEDALADVVFGLTSEGACFALETTGRLSGQRACLASLQRDGVCALVDQRDGSSIDDADQIADGSPTLLSADGNVPPAVLVGELLRLQADGRLPIDSIVDFFPFERVNDALDALRSGRAIKPILRFPLGSFGDLDRAKSRGAGSEATADAPSSDETDREHEKESPQVTV